MDKSIVVENWIIRSQHRPILSEDEHDAFVEWLRKRGGEQIILFPSVYTKSAVRVEL